MSTCNENTYIHERMNGHKQNEQNVSPQSLGVWGLGFRFSFRIDIRIDIENVNGHAPKNGQGSYAPALTNHEPRFLFFLKQTMGLELMHQLL